MTTPQSTPAAGDTSGRPARSERGESSAESVLSLTAGAGPEEELEASVLPQPRPARPDDEPVDLDALAPDEDELYMQRQQERARREIVLASIRAHLEEQPTPGAVFSVSRHWISDIATAADEIAKAKRRAA